MFKILHIAPHYGGGVGTVINSWIKKDKNNSYTLTYLNNISENKKSGQKLLNPDIMNEYDFCIVHVWNHPSLFEFLINTPKPPCRLIGWSHMAGLHAPYILFDKLINYFDLFYYTSPVSHYSGKVKPVIWSTGDISEYQKITKKNHESFNIGYIGTLDFCKLHPNFVEICKEIIIPEATLIVIGTGNDKISLFKKIIEYDLQTQYKEILFMGHINNVIDFIKIFDVFLYPLSEKHFGTCEQVLGEVLSAGIPVVTLNNHAENFIIKNGENGFICNNKKEIAEKITLIAEKKIIFDEKKIKDSAKKLYNINKKINVWNDVFEEHIDILSPKEHIWKKEYNHIFAESLGPYGEIFNKYIKNYKKGNYFDLDYYIIPVIKGLFYENYYQWRSKNKGSIYQYLNYFQNDYYLKKWSELL